MVLALEVVLEDHAPDVGALLAEAPLGAQIRAVELTVGQLTGPVDAGVERLVPFVIAVAPVRAEQVASPLDQRHGPLATVERHRSNQALIAEVAKIVLSQLKRCIARIAQVALGHDTERTRGGEAAAVLADELVAVITVQNDLSFEFTRELKTVQEEVTGVVLTIALIAVSVADVLVAVARVLSRLRIGRWATTQLNPVDLDLTDVVIAIPWIAPSWIVIKHRRLLPARGLAGLDTNKRTVRGDCSGGYPREAGAAP